MKRFVFPDFETTGPDEQVCAPIEVAVVVTDEELVELGSYETLITPPLGGEKPHRAMADVRRSLEDARRFLGVLQCR